MSAFQRSNSEDLLFDDNDDLLHDGPYVPDLDTPRVQEQQRESHQSTYSSAATPRAGHHHFNASQFAGV